MCVPFAYPLPAISRVIVEAGAPRFSINPVILPSLDPSPIFVPIVVAAVVAFPPLLIGSFSFLGKDSIRYCKKTRNF